MKNKINWGFFPESPIKTHSLIEIAIALFIFSTCLYLFITWYKVPEREVIIDIEDLDRKFLLGYDFDPEGKYVNIYYNSMMTYDKNKLDTTLNDLDLFFHKYRHNRKYDSLRTNSVMLDYFKKQMNVHNDDFEFKNKQSLSEFIQQTDSSAYKTIEEKKHFFVMWKSDSVDSMRSFFNARVPDGKSYKADHVKVAFRDFGVTVKNDTTDFKFGLNKYARNCQGGEWRWVESYIYGQNVDASKYSYKCDYKKPWYNFWGPNSQTEAPNILTPWDISQSYYKFKINSLTIDSMNVKIDFKGATVFSKMIPAPDEIGISYIIYTDPYKISKLKEDGIVFHAKFKDLEGLQQIRLFAITGLMGGLFTVFLFFLFLYPAKIYRQIRMSHKKNGTMESPEQSITQEPSVPETTDEPQNPLVVDETSESQESPVVEEANETQTPSKDESLQDQGDECKFPEQ